MWTIETIHNQGGNDAGGEQIRDSIKRLSENSLAAVRIPEVYAADEIDGIVERIGKTGVLWYPNFEFKQGRIGICATEYHAKINGREAYFMLQEEASRIRDSIFPEDANPVDRMVGVFSQGIETAVAQEASMDGASYFTGLIRAMIHQSTLHYDYAPTQLPGWGIGDETQTQFAVVTYLQLPGEGGEITVYNRQWEPEDEGFNADTHEKGPRGFNQAVLGDEQTVTIMPQPGEMVIFNSRNYHQVEAIRSDVARLSVNSFMSLGKDDKLYLWN